MTSELYTLKSCREAYGMLTHQRYLLGAVDSERVETRSLLSVTGCTSEHEQSGIACCGFMDGSPWPGQDEVLRDRVRMRSKSVTPALVKFWMPIVSFKQMHSRCDLGWNHKDRRLRRATSPRIVWMLSRHAVATSVDLQDRSTMAL